MFSPHPQIENGKEWVCITTLCHFENYPNIFFKIMLPTFLSSPLLEVGIPVFLLKFCFACVIPKALFQEKESPGILNDDFFPML